MTLTAIAIRNIGRNRRRSVLSALATAVATMSMVAIAAYINGMRLDMQANVRDFATGHVQVRHGDWDRYERLNPLHLRIERPADLVARLEALPGVAAATARLSLPVGVFRGRETSAATVLGVDVARERGFMRLERLLKEGRLPAPGGNEALIASGLAASLGVRPGDRLTVLSTTMRRSSNALTFHVVGLVEMPVAAMNSSSLIVPLDRAMALARTDGTVTEVVVRAAREGDIAGVRAAVQRVLADGGWQGLSARTWTEASFFLAFFQVAEGLYFVLGLVFFLLASTVLVNTTMMVVFERTREIGTVGALGMTGREIVRMFFLEALALALLGAAGGVVLGLAISIPMQVLGIDMSAATQGMSIEVSGVIFARPRLLTTALIFVYAVAISCLAALLPARRAARVQPVEALRAT